MKSETTGSTTRTDAGYGPPSNRGSSATAGGRPKDLHAAFNDEEYPSALLSFPEKHFIGGETLLHCPLGEPLKFAFTEGREQGDF
jgi:hypothetical protein